MLNQFCDPFAKLIQIKTDSIIIITANKSSLKHFLCSTEIHKN